MPKGKKVSLEQPEEEEEDKNRVHIAPVSYLPAPPPVQPHVPQLALRKARVRNQASSQQGCTDISPRRAWARGELSWLVGFADRDEHVLRVERRLQLQEQAWKVQAAEAGCHRPLRDRASRPSTTSRSEYNRSPRPSVPELDLERILPEVASTASRRASTARMLSRSSARSPRERTRGALTERSRPSTQYSAKEELLAEETTYHTIRNKLVVLGQRRQQLAEDDFRGEMLQKQADIAQSIIHQDDPLALTATVGSLSEIRRVKESGPPSRTTASSPRKQNSGILWDGEERLLSTLFDNDSLWTEMDIDEQHGGFPVMEGTVSWETQASARDSEIHGAVEEEDEHVEPSASKGRRARAASEDEDTEQRAHPLRMDKAQAKEMSRSISKVRTDLKNMNSAIGDWLRGGGTKVYIDRLSQKVKIRSEAKPGTMARNAVSGMQKVQQMLEGALPKSKPKEEPDMPDHRTANKALTDAMRPGVRNTKLISQTMHRYRRSELAQHRRFEIERVRVERIKTEVEGKMVGTRELRKLEEAEEEAARFNQQRFLSWMLLVVAASRMEHMLWRGKQHYFRRDRAARFIQRRFRTRAAGRRQRGGKVWAKHLLKKFLMSVVVTVRFNRNGPAVDTIKRFLYVLQERARVMPAILRFKRKIIIVQSLARGFLTRVRIANVHNYSMWDKVEQRELRLLYKDRAKKHGMVISGKITTTNQFVLEHQVPPHIKIEALRKWLAGQREKFHLRIVVHKIEVAGYTAQVERKHMLTLRLMEFTGATEYSEVERQAESLGGHRYHSIQHPKPIKFRDLCTELEAKTVWLHAAAEHASPELKAFLLEQFGARGPDGPLDATATSISFDSLTPARLRRDASGSLDTTLNSKSVSLRRSAVAGTGAGPHGVRHKQPAAVANEPSTSSVARRSSSGSSASNQRHPPSLPPRGRFQAERAGQHR